VNLQHINFSNNNLSGSLPNSFNLLKNLQALYLSGNKNLCGEIPSFKKTLKDCNFGSTSLCINESRVHCTNGIVEDCSSVNCNGDQESKPTTPVPEDNNDKLTPEDFSNEPSTKSQIFKWIAFGLIIITLLCIIVLILICMKKRFQEPIILEKPLPGRRSNTIFGEDYGSNNMDEQDPDASIQIHTLTRPEQVVVPANDGASHGQASSYDDASQYEAIGGGVNSALNKNNTVNPGRSPVLSNSVYNSGSFYTTNSLGRNQTHSPSIFYNTYSLGRNVSSISPTGLEQDLGELVLDNHGNVIADNNPIVPVAAAATTATASNNTLGTPPPKRVSALFGYSHSQSSPNLVRMNQAANGKRRMTLTTDSSIINGNGNNTQSIDSKHSKHSSIPYPVSPFAKKSPTISARKTYDVKRRSFEEGGLRHNTVHVVNSRKSIPYAVDKSPTTVSSSNANSVHSTTPMISKSKNRTSLPSLKTKKRSSKVLSKYSSQNSMRSSPLANSVENYDMTSVSDSTGAGLYNVNKNNTTSVNPTIDSSSNVTDNSQNDSNENKSGNEEAASDVITHSTKAHVGTTENNSTVSDLPDQDHRSTHGNHEDDQINNQLDTPANVRNEVTSSNVNTQVTTTENPTEAIYIENIIGGGSEEEDISRDEEHSMDSEEECKHYDVEEDYYDYNYENIPEDIREQLEQPQPPNYEEALTESVYSPYIKPNNDEAIRMQLEMRRIEERQLRMEYIQRQIDNPELTDAQRQKYIDALDRLMLELE